MNRRRSILSVPGHQPAMHAKAAASEADCVMLDLEDSVPPDQKKAARDSVRDSVNRRDWGDKVLALRINAVDSPLALRDLLDVFAPGAPRLQHLVLPKVETAAQIHFVDHLLTALEQEQQRCAPLALEISIETARGLEAVSELSRASHRIVALVFGIADYAASLGVPASTLSGHGDDQEAYPGHRWHYPLSRIAMSAHALGLEAVDAPYGDFRDEPGLLRSARCARALGFSAKWAIHPAQLAGIHQVFTPSPTEIEHARNAVNAWREAEQRGRGAVAVDGQMIDQATVRLARRTLANAGLSSD